MRIQTPVKKLLVLYRGGKNIIHETATIKLYKSLLHQSILCKNAPQVVIQICFIFYSCKAAELKSKIYKHLFEANRIV